MGTGDRAPAEDEVLVDIPLRQEAREGHTVGDLNHNLLSLVPMVQQGYIGIFDKDAFNVYDATNTKITVSRSAVLKGWYDPAIKLWRVPLIVNGAATTALIKGTNKIKTLQDILRKHPPPPATHLINNAYKI